MKFWKIIFMKTMQKMGTGNQSQAFFTVFIKLFPK